jgi:hypothetical protein
VAQLYPQALSTHFSRLLRHAWATVGLFFSPVTTRGVAQLLIRYSAFIRYWEFNGRVPRLFIDSEKSYDPVKRGVLYSIPTEFGIPVKLVTLSKTCLNGTYNEVRMGKTLSHSSASIIRMMKQRRLK